MGNICGSRDQGPGARVTRPFTVAVLGGSASGKSTVAGRLAAELNGSAAHAALCQDDFFRYDVYETDGCPMARGASGAVWKDWESVEGVDWVALADAVRQLQSRSSQGTPKAEFVVVEGFRLFARPEIRELFDAAVVIEVSEEETWNRRLARAKSMAHLPPGAGENTNYEVVEVYTRAGPEREAALRLSQKCGAHGSYAWLRLYFEEVVLPGTRVAVKEPELGGVPVLRLDGEVPVGKDAWADARVPEAVAFLRSPWQTPHRPMFWTGCFSFLSA